MYGETMGTDDSELTDEQRAALRKIRSIKLTIAGILLFFVTVVVFFGAIFLSQPETTCEDRFRRVQSAAAEAARNPGDRGSADRYDDAVADAISHGC